MRLRTTLALLSGLLSIPVYAQGPTEKGISETISKAFSMPVEKVTKSNFGELYEVLVPQGIAYTDKAGSFLMFNSVVIDTKTQENLTQKRMDVLSAFKFSELPLKDAIKVVNGNGKRVIATIEDPNCGYCKKLIKELVQLKDTTIYTFLTPVLGEDSVHKSRSIWCSANPAKTWVSWMNENVAIPQNENCETPLERNTLLSRKLRVMGTPAILFQNGERLPGYAPLDKIEEKLLASTKEHKK